MAGTLRLGIGKRLAAVGAIGVACALGAVGCSRGAHLRRADRDARAILAEKTDGHPWTPAGLGSAWPDPRARFAFTGPPTSPSLPAVGARMFGPSWLRGQGFGAAGPSAPASARDRRPGGNSGPAAAVLPVDQEEWNRIPPWALAWMLELPSIRSEYRATFDRDPPPHERLKAVRLDFAELVELARIHSTEYQARREALYRAALRLTLERYAYLLRFPPTGTGTTVDWTHDRTGGLTVGTLAVPTTLRLQRLLATGGNLVAEFANDVLLTFGGPSGFSADVGSQLLLRLSQSLFQRDIVFESLTQAERDVVYAARDYARFRRRFYRDLVKRYYQLLLNYRGVAIRAQDYFSNARAFRQGQAELAANRLPRFQVDQFEQNALASLSQLIRQVNTLLDELDNFKLFLGVPPEITIHLDLSELERLTARDEATVRMELARRSLEMLQAELRKSRPDPSVVLAQSLELVERLMAFSRSLADLSEDGSAPSIPAPLAPDRLTAWRRRLHADEGWLAVALSEEILATTVKPDTPPLQRLQRILSAVEDWEEASLREWAARSELEQAKRAELVQRVETIRKRRRALREAVDRVVDSRQLEQLAARAAEAQTLLDEARQLGRPWRLAPPDGWADRKWLKTRVRDVHMTARTVLAAEQFGLPEIRIAADDAMLTALSLRWDLANTRERMADAWRRVKLAADALRSVVRVDAAGSVRTDPAYNRVFDFSWRESNANVRLRIDTPLNRIQQRNAYREAFMAYNAALRDWIAQSDAIKRDIRRDLRALVLDRIQYEIAIASAALALERVVSTRLQLRLGIGNVAARDFLEAQQAYTASLDAVAREHIGYLTDRLELFFDLEQLVLDPDSLWRGKDDPAVVPEVDFTLEQSGPSPYGDLPRGVWYSREVRQMLRVPVLPPQKELEEDQEGQEDQEDQEERDERARAGAERGGAPRDGAGDDRLGK